MPAWGENTGNFIYAKIGEPAVKLTIKETKRIDGQSKFNLKDKQGTDLGYHYQIITNDDKIFTINTWVLLKALNAAGVREGDTIAINRPEKGKYNVTKKPTNKQEEPEYLKEINKKYGVKATEAVEW